MTKRPALLFYGGSFDPIHQGHLDIIQGVRPWFPQAPLLISPTKHHFYKTAQASFEHRLAMIKLATAKLTGHPMQIYPYEQHATEAIATHSIIQQLQHAYPNHVIFVIFGVDVLNTLPDWPEWSSLLSLCNLLIIQRPPEILSSQVLQQITSYWRPDLQPQQLQTHGFICPITLHTTMISSSKIRKQYLSRGLNSPWLQPEVKRYILQHQLYQTLNIK